MKILKERHATENLTASERFQCALKLWKVSVTDIYMIKGNLVKRWFSISTYFLLLKIIVLKYIIYNISFSYHIPPQSKNDAFFWIHSIYMKALNHTKP